MSGNPLLQGADRHQTGFSPDHPGEPRSAVIVFACANPEPHLRMLDRFLVIAEKQQIPPVIVANKADLVQAEAAHKIFGIYTNLDYQVIYTSAKTGEGVVTSAMR